MRSDDFREELLSAKKAHQVALRENAHFRTRLRVAESECRRREAEIERLLKAQTNDGTEGNGARARLEMASLRRKVMLYERMLHEKSAENEKLLSDKGVAQSAEMRKTVIRLESECQRLRSHLARSVPESEFLREKEEYTEIIKKLMEENMHLRNVIGEFEQRRKDSERIIVQLGGSDAMVRQFRQTAICSKRQASFYRKALGNLIKRKGNGSRETAGGGEIVNVGREGAKDGEGWQRMNGASERRNSESDSSRQREERKRNNPKMRECGRDGKTEERKLEAEEEGVHKGTRNADTRQKVALGGGDRRSAAVLCPSRSSSTPPATSPRGAVVLLPPYIFSTASEGEQRDGEKEEEQTNGEEGKEREGEEEEEKEEGEEEEEKEEDEEEEATHCELNALSRVLHSHILRQQMLKVRRERDDPPNWGGMGHFF